MGPRGQIREPGSHTFRPPPQASVPAWGMCEGAGGAWGVDWGRGGSSSLGSGEAAWSLQKLRASRLVNKPALSNGGVGGSPRTGRGLGVESMLEVLGAWELAETFRD